MGDIWGRMGDIWGRIGDIRGIEIPIDVESQINTPRCFVAKKREWEIYGGKWEVYGGSKCT